jgi:hypothetical protein
MDIVYLRSQMLDRKDFLAKIFRGNSRQNRKIILCEEEKNLNILVKILHLIVNGHIKIGKEQFKCIVKSRRLGKLRSLFEKKSSYVSILKSSINKKKEVLVQFSSIYCKLLHFLFFLD